MTNSGPNDDDTATGAGDDAGFSAAEQAVDSSEFNVEPLVDGKSRRNKVGFLALLVSFVALAIVAFSTLQEWRAGNDDNVDAPLQAVSESLGVTQATLRTMEEQLAAVSSELGAVREGTARQLDNNRSGIDDRLRQLEAMPGRLASVEASLATLQGISTGARAAWLLAEAEYYMQIANAQLQLANNPDLAKTALSHADERLVQLGDPRLTGVRQAIADELRALNFMQTPDTTGITLTLASLASAIDALPLRQQDGSADNSAASNDEAQSGIDRALTSMKRTLSDAVKVRRSDEAMQPLIAPEAQYFLRANLALQLQIARLALLRGEESVFRQTLDDADSWLALYYDASNSAVQNARETISDIRSNTLTVATPDISQSLRRLRQFNALNTAAGTDAEAEPAQ